MKIFNNFLDIVILTISYVALGYLLSFFSDDNFSHNIYYVTLLFFIVMFAIYAFLKLVMRK